MALSHLLYKRNEEDGRKAAAWTFSFKPATRIKEPRQEQYLFEEAYYA
jgi:hypothetical protein